MNRLLHSRRNLLIAAAVAYALTLSALATSSARADWQGHFTWRIGEVTASSNVAGTSSELTTVLESNDDAGEQDLQSFTLRWPDGLISTVGRDEYCDLGQHSNGVYYCRNPNARKVGTQKMLATATLPIFGESEVLIESNSYADTPEPGKAALSVSIPVRLFIPLPDPFPDIDENEIPNEVSRSSAVLRSDGSGVDVHVERVPYEIPNPLYEFGIGGRTLPIHIYRLESKVLGNDITSSGRPILTIPAICRPIYFDATFKSYGDDDDPNSGDERTINVTKRFPVTNCGGVPYRPTLNLSLTSSLAGASSNLLTATSAPTGDAPTKEMRIKLPPGFTMAPRKGVRSCTQAEISSFSCQSSSSLGSFTISSVLLPEPMQGTIHQAEPRGGSVIVAVLLMSDRGNIRLSGELRRAGDGGMEMVFPSFPPIAMGNVGMQLDSTSGGSLLNPFTCGTSNATSTFVSHNDKWVGNTHPLTITGCKAQGTDTALKVKLWKRASNRHTDIRFKVSQHLPAKVRKATFYLPNKLVIRRRQPRGKRLAYVEFWDRTKEKRAAMFVSKRTKRSLYLKPKNRQLKGLKVRIYRERGRTQVSVTNIPDDRALADFSLRLFGKRSKLVRTFKRCVRHRNLSFSVKVTGEGGEARRATDKVKVLCQRKRALGKRKRTSTKRKRAQGSAK